MTGLKHIDKYLPVVVDNKTILYDMYVKDVWCGSRRLFSQVLEADKTIGSIGLDKFRSKYIKKDKND